MQYFWIGFRVGFCGVFVGLGFFVVLVGWLVFLPSAGLIERYLLVNACNRNLSCF